MACVPGTTSQGTALKGLRVGDESVIEVLRPSATGAKCIGCHSSTPDGEYVALASSAIVDDGRPSGVSLSSSSGGTGRPAYLSATAATLLARQPQQSPQFSPTHWTTGDRLALTIFPVNKRNEIVWTDLEATSMAEGTGWGILARTGDANQASYAAFSHDGKTVVYGSSPSIFANINQETTGDLYVNVSSYNNRQAEIMVASLAGGPATRLLANDPPACTNIQSPGILNSWSKWGSEVKTVGTKTYYWLIFSSGRLEVATPLLYLTAIVKDGDKLTSYPAFYLWNQPPTEANHTPAWGAFKIPVIP